MANGKDDIRVAWSFPRHPKTLALIDLVGERGAFRLLALWCFAAENRPDGVFKSEAEIERGAGWRGRKGEFHAALITCGWLEADGVTLHDWKVEQPWAANRMARHAAAQANAHARWDADRMRNGCGPHAGGNAPTPTPTPTPTPSEKNPLPPSGAPPPVGGKPRSKVDPLVAALRARLGCGARIAADQIRALRVAKWDDARIREAIETHAEPGLAPWDWTRRANSADAARTPALTKPDGSLTPAGILAAGRAMGSATSVQPPNASPPRALPPPIGGSQPHPTPRAREGSGSIRPGAA